MSLAPAAEFLVPGTLEAAQASLDADRSACLIAGGQSLLPRLRRDPGSMPALIRLPPLAPLRSIDVSDGQVSLGAAVTHRDLMRSEVLAHHLPVLPAMAKTLGDPAVWTFGTVGGVIAEADPRADYWALFIALDAVIDTTDGAHRALEYFGQRRPGARARNAIVTRVHIPLPRAAAYEKFRHPTTRWPAAGVFVATRPDGLTAVAIGAADQPIRFDPQSKAFAADGRARPTTIEDFPSASFRQDPLADPAWRAHLIGVLARRALAGLA
ncbi:MAG: FAD binding domain-containing protein [Pseudomonadota bacterium]